MSTPGNCFNVVLDGSSGTTEPFEATSPTQSCAPRMTSGAVSVWTVLRSSRIGPISFCTTETFTPLLCAHRLAIFVTAGTRSLSAQMTIVGVAFRALVAGETTTTTASATTTSASTARSVRIFNI